MLNYKDGITNIQKDGNLEPIFQGGNQAGVTIILTLMNLIWVYWCILHYNLYMYGWSIVTIT